jgi:hypothetical protein
MKKRLILCQSIILAVALTSLPVSHAQTSALADLFIQISSYQDDPFVRDSIIERMDGSGFEPLEGGRLRLTNKQVIIQDDEDVIYRADPKTGDFKPFANNPWPEPKSNERGNFKFPREERFPLHEVERGPDGRPIVRAGLQVWKERDLHLGMTTAFKAANSARDAAEFWSGRDVAWGTDNVLGINSHAFVDFNAFYSPSARQLFFGVVPYRLPGEAAIKMFEMSTSWEVAAHEAAHALHHVLKPNIDVADVGFRTWGESFADQVEMWASLRDPRRVRLLLAETDDNLYSSNALTRIGEAFASLVGEGTGVRDAYQNKKVSDTSDEVHDRSEVLTGATYKFFLLVYSGLKQDQGLRDLDALIKAGEIMGIFNVRATDYTPENSLTLEDVAKAYLKVDKEFYGGRYHKLLVDEFTRREIFGDTSESDWLAHEAALPGLRLSPQASDDEVERLLQANLDELGIGVQFGLRLQSVTRDTLLGQTIVRVQLTEGHGSDAVALDNHGVLVFRQDGTLAGYHSPLSPDSAGPLRLQTETQRQMPALIERAKRLGLDRRGTPLSIVRRLGGQLTVEARVMRSQGFYCWMEVFTLENPRGERREIVTPTIPRKISGYQRSGVEILTADDLAER